MSTSIRCCWRYSCALLRTLSRNSFFVCADSLLCFAAAALGRGHSNALAAEGFVARHVEVGLLLRLVDDLVVGARGVARLGSASVEVVVEFLVAPRLLDHRPRRVAPDLLRRERDGLDELADLVLLRFPGLAIGDQHAEVDGVFREHVERMSLGQQLLQLGQELGRRLDRRADRRRARRPALHASPEARRCRR